jgi:Mg/Co/Ni transporter MgtE
MEMTKEALKLADDMEVRAKIRRSAKDRKSVQENSNDRISDQLEQASTMIRRLVEELDKHKQINGVFDYYCDENIRSKQTKPLSDEEIIEQFDDSELLASWGSQCPNNQDVIDFVRAIEERHGIK